MKRFRRRQEDYEEDGGFEDGSEEGGNGHQKLFRKKDFRDLNPQDKKRRSEPKKPWGKKERLMVLLTILITAGVSLALYISAIGFKTPKAPDIKLPRVSTPNLFGEETVIYNKED